MLPVHHHRAPAGVSAAAAAEEDERGGGGPRWRPVRLRTCVVDPQNKPKTISSNALDLHLQKTGIRKGEME
jgi:hypothetical protein